MSATASACNFDEVDACYGRYLTSDPPLPHPIGMESVGACFDGVSIWWA